MSDSIGDLLDTALAADTKARDTYRQIINLLGAREKAIRDEAEAWRQKWHAERERYRDARSDADILRQRLNELEQSAKTADAVLARLVDYLADLDTTHDHPVGDGEPECGACVQADVLFILGGDVPVQVIAS